MRFDYSLETWNDSNLFCRECILCHPHRGPHYMRIRISLSLIRSLSLLFNTFCVCARVWAASLVVSEQFINFGSLLGQARPSHCMDINCAHKRLYSTLSKHSALTFINDKYIFYSSRRTTVLLAVFSFLFVDKWFLVCRMPHTNWEGTNRCALSMFYLLWHIDFNTNCMETHEIHGKIRMQFGTAQWTLNAECGTLISGRQWILFLFHGVVSFTIIIFYDLFNNFGNYVYLAIGFRR